ncbi:HEAT repeat domain-containing protein [Burkholderia lata]|nr:HEAT repeat domain-containing protein [Burkholderia lata]
MRHAQDAAFYWSQSDSSLCSPTVSIKKLASFHSLLEANLDGLRVAGDAGMLMARRELDRWKSQGDAFVYGVLSFEKYADSQFEPVWDLLDEHAESTVYGFSCATSWASRKAVFARLEQWKATAHPIPLALSVIARRELALPIASQDVARYFDHESHWVRGAACHLAAELPAESARDFLLRALDDGDLDVQIAAADALMALGRDARVRHRLVDMVGRCKLLAEEQRGLAKQIALARMDRLARYLGHAVNCGDPEAREVLAMLPAELQIPFIAHHGDPAFIDDLIARLSNNRLSDAAFQAMHLITGIDLDDSQFLVRTASTPDEDSDEDSLQHLDSTRLQPDHGAITDWWDKKRAHFKSGTPWLVGSSALNHDHVSRIFHLGSQLQRFAAQMHAFSHNISISRLDIRTPMWRQPRNSA